MADVGEQGRKVGRIVRQVGVDLHADVGTVPDRVGDSPAVRRSEPALRRPVDHGDVTERGGEAVGELRCPVGAGVVDHDDADPRFDVAQPAHEQLEAGDLVVRRHDRHHPHRRDRTAPSVVGVPILGPGTP